MKETTEYFSMQFSIYYILSLFISYVDMWTSHPVSNKSEQASSYIVGHDTSIFKQR